MKDEMIQEIKERNERVRKVMELQHDIIQEVGGAELSSMLIAFMTMDEALEKLSLIAEMLCIDNKGMN